MSKKCYIPCLLRLEIAGLARSVEVTQKGRHQRFAIVLPLLVEARSEGHQIAIDGGMTHQMIYHGDGGWKLENM